MTKQTREIVNENNHKEYWINSVELRFASVASLLRFHNDGQTGTQRIIEGRSEAGSKPE